jgi:hypothetical protein
MEDHHDTSMSLLDMIRYYPQPNPPLEHWVRPELPLPPREYPAGVIDPVLQTRAAATRLAPATGLNFEGNDFDLTCNCAPPDTNGAVGTTQYVQLVNTVFTVYNKSNGAVVAGPTATNTLWSGFGGTCSTANDGDGTVAFDKLADRWVFQQFVVSTTPYMECIAVSQTSDATGAYNRYAFNFGTSDFPDYPKLAIWPDAYYMSFNIFLNGATFIGPDACAFDRTNILTGAAASPMQCFQQSTSINPLLPSDLDGTTPPPSGEPNFFMTYGSSGVLNLFKYHVDFTTPSNSTFTGPTNISVAAFTPASSLVSQPSPGEGLDTLSDRPMYRAFYRNFGTHESVGFNHSVGSPSGIRWYEIQNPNGTPVVAQQGTFSPDSSDRWMGSTAMDSAGDQAIGYSVTDASTGLDPSVRFTGRTPSDPAGMMEAETNVVTGTGVQEATSDRWGDYSAMQVDPVDDCTFWYTQEYIVTTGSFNWATRIANFKFPNCGASPNFSISASPSSVSVQQGNSGNSTISTTALNGFNSAITLSASGQPSGVTVTFGTNPIPAPGTGSSVMTMAVAAGVATGTYTITVTGTGGGKTNTTTVSLTVTAASTPDFTIGASPSSVSVQQGNSGNSTISTTALNGFNNAITLSASGQPSEVTVTFGTNPIPAPGTGSSVMTMAVGAAVATGTYNITVTGTGGGVTHTVTVSLTVTSSNPPNFSITASPSSVTVTRGTSGTSTISTTALNGFNSAISLSASGQGGRVTVTFSPNPIPAPGTGSSTMKISVNRRATRGTRTITVTGTGGVTHTTTVILTIQ